MQVFFFFREPPVRIRHAELSFPQITVTTERIEEHSKVSIDESEYELQKMHSVSRISPSEALEEDGSPDSRK